MQALLHELRLHELEELRKFRTQLLEGVPDFLLEGGSAGWIIAHLTILFKAYTNCVF